MLDTLSSAKNDTSTIIKKKTAVYNRLQEHVNKDTLMYQACWIFNCQYWSKQPESQLPEVLVRKQVYKKWTNNLLQYKLTYTGSP